MQMPNDPTPAFSQIEHLWPKRASDLLQCPARVAFDMTSTPRRGGGRAPKPLVQILGDVVHSCIENHLENRAADFDELWGEACRENSAESYQTDPEFNKKKRRLKARWNQLLEFVEEQESDGLELEGVEEQLTSRNGLFRGQPDLFLMGDIAVVVDHKSGDVIEDEEIKEEYDHQLLVYAHLIEENYEVSEVEACLFSLTDGLIEVDVSKEVRKGFIADLVAAVDEYNSTEGPPPTKPSAKNCSWCRHRYQCEGFWKAIGESGMEELKSGEAFWGNLSGEFIHGENGKSTVGVIAEQGTVEGRVLLQGIPTEKISNIPIQPEVKVKCLGFKTVTSESETKILAWKKNSSISRFAD
jgi:CRISPR/Cas system-associated exonuclease Cas4 (RecB family)